MIKSSLATLQLHHDAICPQHPFSSFSSPDGFPLHQREEKEEGKLPRCPSYPQLELRKTHAQKSIIWASTKHCRQACNCIWCNTWSELDARRIPLSHVPNEGQEWAGHWHKKDHSAFNIQCTPHISCQGGSDSATILVINWNYDKL